MKTPLGQQIPLHFAQHDRLDFDLYVLGQNGQVWTHLQRVAAGEESKNIYLWGSSGSGKTHLLQAVCTAAAQREKKPAYLPLSQYKRLHTSMLEGLERLDLVCLDGLDCVAGDDEWERAILDLFNRIREKKRPLLMTALTNALPVKLPDLKSRLSWDLNYHLYGLTEKERGAALCMRARSRGFELPSGVVLYLLTHIERDMHSLFAFLDKIDKASLSAKKKITIPFVKDIIKTAEADKHAGQKIL